MEKKRFRPQPLEMSRCSSSQLFQSEPPGEPCVFQADAGGVGTQLFGMHVRPSESKLVPPSPLCREQMMRSHFNTRDAMLEEKAKHHFQVYSAASPRTKYGACATSAQEIGWSVPERRSAYTPRGLFDATGKFSPPRLQRLRGEDVPVEVIPNEGFVAMVHPAERERHAKNPLVSRWSGTIPKVVCTWRTR